MSSYIKTSCVLVFHDYNKNHISAYEGGDKGRSVGGNSSTIYLIYCKNFCKCHNVPPPSTTIFFKKIFLLVRRKKLHIALQLPLHVGKEEV
jgi:hypothetical protein